MICERCDSEFQTAQCSCGWRPPKLEVEHQEPVWTRYECANATCHVMIRERPGAVGSDLCKWCLSNGVTVTAEIMQDVPELRERRVLSKEEFGLARYDAIRGCAARDQVRGFYRQMVTDLSVPAPERRRRLEELKQREAALTVQLVALMPLLTAEDQRRLLARYESTSAA